MAELSLTVIIMIVIGGMSLLAWKDESLFHKWVFNPYTVKRNNEYHRFITSGMIHADYFHLGFNLFVLYSFGMGVEALFGAYFGVQAGMLYYVLLILGAFIVSDLPSYFKYKDQPRYNSLGASGAVSAVIFAVILYRPMMPIQFILFPFFDIPGVVMGIMYLIYEHYQGQRARDNVNHDAHFYGAVFGVAFAALTRPITVLEFFAQIIGHFS